MSRRWVQVVARATQCCTSITYRFWKRFYKLFRHSYTVLVPSKSQGPRRPTLFCFSHCTSGLLRGSYPPLLAAVPPSWRSPLGVCSTSCASLVCCACLILPWRYLLHPCIHTGPGPRYIVGCSTSKVDKVHAHSHAHACVHALTTQLCIGCVQGALQADRLACRNQNLLCARAGGHSTRATLTRDSAARALQSPKHCEIFCCVHGGLT